jgi:phage terminase large subunit-like protein
LRDWDFIAREDQRAPAGDWAYWLLLAGRGAGKTRTGAEWFRHKIKSGCARMAIVAATAADARDVMIEGESGLLSVSFNKDRTYKGDLIGYPYYEPSKRRLTWANGALATVYSAEEPDRLRGPQHDSGWADELAAWADPNEAWDMLMFGMRLGTNPQVMISTTPRPIPIIRELIRDPSCAVTRASTYANRANLAKAFFKKIISKYEGTRLGRQELLAEVIEEIEGALWTREMIEQARMGERKVPDFKRVVVSIDPATTSGEASALTGITCGGLGVDDLGYLLADKSGRYSPLQWANNAIKLYDDYKADRIVAEGNQGGEMVRHTIHSVRPNIPVRIVHASRSKQARAEPVAALYEQKKIIHVEPFPELEDQYCTWAPLEGLPSPDRLDSAVWLFTDLMVGVPMTVDLGNPVNVQVSGLPGQQEETPPELAPTVTSFEGTHDPSRMF